MSANSNSGHWWRPGQRCSQSSLRAKLDKTQRERSLVALRSILIYAQPSGAVRLLRENRRVSLDVAPASEDRPRAVLTTSGAQPWGDRYECCRKERRCCRYGPEFTRHRCAGGAVASTAVQGDQGPTKEVRKLATAYAMGRARGRGTAKSDRQLTPGGDFLKGEPQSVLRGPLQWAMVQNNLGNALQTLGARESGTARPWLRWAGMRARQ